MEPCTTNHEPRILDGPGSTRNPRSRPSHGDRLLVRTTDAVPSALRELVAQGFTSTQAGNLAAYLLGMERSEHGWTVDEIERLLFVSHLVSRRRIWS